MGKGCQVAEFGFTKDGDAEVVGLGEFRAGAGSFVVFAEVESGGAEGLEEGEAWLGLEPRVAGQKGGNIGSSHFKWNEGRSSALIPAVTTRSSFFTIYAYAQALDQSGNIGSESLTKTLVEVEVETPARAVRGRFQRGHASPLGVLDFLRTWAPLRPRTDTLKCRHGVAK